MKIHVHFIFLSLLLSILLSKIEGDAAGLPRVNATIKHRFSTLRYSRTVKQFNPIQKGYIINRHLGHLLNVPDHLMIPLNILQWLVQRMSYGGGGVFSHKNKSFTLTKDIVDKVFGFPSGLVPFVLKSEDPDVVNEVENLRKQFFKGKNIPIKHLEYILLGTKNELVFLRSFILYFITTILCPSTYNFVNPKYLYSLRDSDHAHVKQLDFGTLCLTQLFEEIDAWIDKIFMNPGDLYRITWIGGCLPLLGIAYMDFVDFNGNPDQGHISNPVWQPANVG